VSTGGQSESDDSLEELVLSPVGKHLGHRMPLSSSHLSNTELAYLQPHLVLQFSDGPDSMPFMSCITPDLGFLIFLPATLCSSIGRSESLMVSFLVDSVALGVWGGHVKVGIWSALSGGVLAAVAAFAIADAMLGMLVKGLCWM